MSAAKNWCFTINNYTQDEMEIMDCLSMKVPAEISYLVIGKETGENGTPHFQGFIQLVKKQRVNQVRNLLGGRAHCEIMAQRSNPFAAALYCKKEGQFVEYGLLQNSGMTLLQSECFTRYNLAD